MEVDGASAVCVTSKGGIVLEAVTRAVLVHGEAGHVALRVAALHRGTNLHAGGQTLERVVQTLPPTLTLGHKYR